jgi:hypothetical protein
MRRIAIACLAFALFRAAIFALCFWPSLAWAALAVDAATPATGSVSTGTTISLSISTSGTNRLVVVEGHSERTVGQGSHATMSVSGGGLTWHARSQVVLDNAGVPAAYNDVEVWWAYAPTALTAAAITVTFSATVDGGTAVGSAVSGGPCTFASPWDANGSLPATATSVSTSTLSVPGVSTTTANSMIIGVTGSATATGIVFVATSPFTMIGNAAVNATTNASGTGIEQDVVAATQSAITVPMQNGGTVNSWQMIADAIVDTCAPPGAASAHSLMLMGVGN